MKSILSSALLLSSLLSAAQPAQKTTAIKKRLITTVNYVEGSKHDSVQHIYSNGRGSDLTDLMSYTDNYSISVQIPANGSEQSIHCDSSVFYTFFNPPTSIKTFTKTYTYTNNLVATSKSRNLINAGTNLSITRNSFGKPIKMVDSSSGTSFSRQNIRYLAYNSNQLLIIDSTFDVKNNTPTTVNTFLYDQRNLDTLRSLYEYLNGSIFRISHQRKKYDASKRLIYTLWQYDINGTLQNAVLDSFGYRGSDSISNYFTEYNWNPNINEWEGVQKKRRFFSTNGTSDTLMKQTWRVPNWDTSDIKVTHYDNDGYIEHTEDYEYIGDGLFAPSPLSESYFYFERYFPTGISSTKTFNQDIIISPNPSNGNININAGNTYFNNIVIADLQGRTVYTKSISAANNVALNTQLPPGYYVVNLYNEGASIASQKLIIE